MKGIILEVNKIFSIHEKLNLKEAKMITIILENQQIFLSIMNYWKFWRTTP